MSVIDELKIMAKNGNGIIRTKAAMESGISRAMLSKLTKEGKLLRIVQGQYIFSDDMEDEMLSLSYRSKYIVFSHESALFLHGISDRTPFEHTVTVPSSIKLSRGLSAMCKVYYVKQERHALGKEMIETPMGNLVPVYDLERTICDVIRSRNRIGEETLLASLKAYARGSEKNLSRLENYATAFGLTASVRQYLEVLL